MPTDPTPPNGYQLVGKMNFPETAPLSPDIEDRRNWGSVRKAIGQQGQDFRDEWRDFRRTFPDLHTAYTRFRDAYQGKPAQPISDNVPIYAKGAAPAPKVGDAKKFPNGKIGVWDGHGWVAQ